MSLKKSDKNLYLLPAAMFRVVVYGLTIKFLPSTVRVARVTTLPISLVAIHE